jgi:hypothetical protein
MHAQPPCSPRYIAAIGSSLVIVLIVIASDVVISAGVVRDVIVALGQHLVILGTTTDRTRSPHTLNQECPRCQNSRPVRSRRRRSAFPALKDNIAMRSVASGRITIY